MSNSKRPTPDHKTKNALDQLKTGRSTPPQETKEALDQLKSGRSNPTNETLVSLEELRKHAERMREESIPEDKRKTVVLPSSVNQPSPKSLRPGHITAADVQTLKNVNEMREQSQRTSSKEEKRPVALIDVDGTLIPMGNTTNRMALNMPLLQSLLKKGVKDIYLFTNMTLYTLQDEVIGKIGLSRAEIVDQLTAMGFKVHGVVTPADVSYSSPDPATRPLGGVFKDFYLKQRNRLLYYFHNEKSTDIHDIKLAKDGNPDFNDKEFTDEAAKVSKYKESTKDKLEKLADEIEKKEKGVKSKFNIKGIMYDFFLKNKPSWVGSVVMIDDEEGCLDTVKKINTHSNNSLPISTIDVGNSKVGDAFSPDKKIQQANEKLYDQNLDEHFKMLVNQEPELKRLVEAVHQFQTSFQQTKGFFAQLKHKKEMNELISSVDKIVVANLSPKQKLVQITELLQKSYEKQEQKHSKRIFFFQKKKSMTERLAMNPKKYHFERMLGLVLKSLQTSSTPEVKQVLKNKIDIKELDTPAYQNLRSKS